MKSLSHTVELLRRTPDKNTVGQKKPFSLTLIIFWVCTGCYPTIHMAVRRQSSVTGQPNVLAQRKTNSTNEAAVAARRYLDSWRAPVHECAIHMSLTWPNTWSDWASAHASHHLIFQNNTEDYFLIWNCRCWLANFLLSPGEGATTWANLNTACSSLRNGETPVDIDGNSFRVRCVLVPVKIDVFPYFSYNKLQQWSTNSRSQNRVHVGTISVQIHTKWLNKSWAITELFFDCQTQWDTVQYKFFFFSWSSWLQQVAPLAVVRFWWGFITNILQQDDD